MSQIRSVNECREALIDQSLRTMVVTSKVNFIYKVMLSY